MQLDNIITHNHLIKPPDGRTKLVSSFSILFFLIALVIGAYAVSIHNKKLSQDDFTVSSALEHGDKYTMVIFFTLSFIFIIYLNMLRSKNFLYKTRILILSIVYICLITIIWLTVDVNKDLHYIFAGIIFSLNIIYLFCISYMFDEYLKRKNIIYRYILDIIITLTIITWISLIIFGLTIKDNNDIIADEEIFAISENVTVLLSSAPILFLGFI